MNANAGSYKATYSASTENPGQFWLDAASGIDWVDAPVNALDDSAAPVYRCFCSDIEHLGDVGPAGRKIVGRDAGQCGIGVCQQHVHRGRHVFGRDAVKKRQS